MAVKFSEFTIETIPGNVSYLVGYSGSSNIRIAPGNLLSGVIPYTGASLDVNLGAFGITASQFIKSGGISSQFLKADGSIDSNTYLTAASGYVPYTGSTSDLDLGTHSITATTIIKVGGTSIQYLMADGSVSSGPSFAGYVPYTGATNNLDLGTHTITATTIYKVGGTSSQFLMADGSTSLGPAGYVTYIGATDNVDLGVYTITASSIIKSGGLASEFLKANGSVDSTLYYPYPTGAVSEYVRGDGSIATLPTTGGGGGNNVSYYLNGGTAASVPTYYQMSFDAAVGTNVDFTKSGNGLISQWLTDVNNPNQIEIKAGNWNFEIFMSASSSGGTPAFYVELLKYNGATFTTIANSSAIPEGITGGTAIDLYLTSLAIPYTTLLSTDRLAIRVYIVNSISGRTITMHTQDSHLCQIITNFASGISSLNGLTRSTQYFSIGTSGTDFNISSVSETHTFNLPTASAVNRGALSSADWSMFNSKQNTLTIGNITSTTTDIGITGGTSAIIGSGVALTLSNTGVTAGAYGNGVTVPNITVDAKGRVTLLSTTAIPTAGVLVTGLLTSADWNTFYNKQNPITLTTTGNSGAATFIGGTLNIPQYITTTAQSFTGTKTFDDGIAIPSDMNASFGFSSQIYEDSVDGYFNIVSASSVGVSIRSTDSSIEIISYSSLFLNADSTGNLIGDINFYTQGLPRVIITNGGYVGFGKTNPTKIIDTISDILVNGLTVGKGGGNISSNVALGFQSLINNTTGDNNVAIGSYGQKTNTTGASNVSVGNNALEYNNANNNTAIGLGSLNQNTTGFNNVGLGLLSLQLNTIGYLNTAIGTTSLNQNTTGNQNTAIGNSSLYQNTTGNQNTAIGNDAQTLNSNNSNSIIIGANATGLGSNTTVIGNSSTVTSAIYGRLLLGTTTDDGVNRLQVAGGVKLTGTLRTTGLATFDVGTQVPVNQISIFGINSQIYEDDVDGYFNIFTSASAGISIRTPDSYLELNSNTSGISALQNFFISADYQGNSSGDISFYTFSQPRAIITNDGKFGINNYAPSTEIFQVTGNTLLTGTLKVTGSIYTALTTGSVAFINASGLLTQDNANFFWDNTNKRLGIGTATPATFLSIYNANSNAAKTEVMRMEVKNSASALLDYFKFTLGATTARGGSIIFGETGGGFPEAGMEFNLNHTIIYQGGAYPIYLKTNNVNRLTVTSTGSFLMNQTTDDLVNKVQITGNIKCIGDIILAYTTKSIGTTLVLSERTIEVTMAITLTLPTATGNTGKEYVIKNNISAGGSVTITGTIDGAASYILSARYKYVHIISNGTSWLIIANN